MKIVAAAEADAVGGFGADVEVGVFAEEGGRGHGAARERHLVEVVDLGDGQAQVGQVQGEGGVGHVAAR